MSAAWPDPRWYSVGPHGFFDLIRLARTGRTATVRVGYILVLFAALTVSFYTSHPPGAENRQESLNWNASIAERFVTTILVMQYVAVVVLAPIYMAASIQEERDNRTLPLLFTTHLTAGEIVLGKWLSRSVQVGSVLLAGLPVLSLAQLWGGVDMRLIAVHFLNTALVLASVGALSMFIAVQNRSMLLAVGKTYFVLISALLLFGFGSCAGVALFFVTPTWLMIAIWAGFLMVFTVVALWHAARKIRSVCADDGPSERLEPGISNRRNRFWRWPPLPDAAVAWKECYLDRTVWHILPYATLPCMVALVAAVLFSLVMADAEHANRRGMDGAATLVATFTLGFFSVFILTTVFRLTGSIVGERQRRTLEMILTTPIGPRDFVNQKVIGNLRRQSEWLVPVGLGWFCLLIYGHERLVVGLLLPIVMAVHLAFFVALGLFLSVHCRTTLSAYISLGIVLALLVFGLPLFLAFADFSPFARSLGRGISPVQCWITLMSEWRYPGGDAPAIIGCVLVYAAAAVAFWRVACRRFERDPLG